VVSAAGDIAHALGFAMELAQVEDDGVTSTLDERMRERSDRTEGRLVWSQIMAADLRMTQRSNGPRWEGGVA
jgi:hypothetical protein